MASQEQDRPSPAPNHLNSASESHHPNPVDIPFDTIQHYRGIAQENSMNALQAAQERYEHSQHEDVPDGVYDAIEKAKLIIAEKNNVDSGGKSELETEHPGSSDRADQESGDAEEKSGKNDNAVDSSTEQSTGMLESTGGTVSGYVQSIKNAVVGGS